MAKRRSQTYHTVNRAGQKCTPEATQKQSTIPIIARVRVTARLVEADVIASAYDASCLRSTPSSPARLCTPSLV
jgi:hypothetical protein